MDIILKPVGYVNSSRKEKKDDYWGKVESVITLDENRFSPDALIGLSDFSHLEIIFFMDRVQKEKIVFGARHPRNNDTLPKVGIFAQRAKSRPNTIGLSVCKLLKVEGLSIFVLGLDAIDKTPVLDIKPFVKEFMPREETVQPTWISQIMKNYYI